MLLVATYLLVTLLLGAVLLRTVRISMEMVIGVVGVAFLLSGQHRLLRRCGNELPSASEFDAF